MYRIMKKYDLKAKIRRINKSRISLEKNKENIAVANLLNREFKQITPYKFLSTDISYLKHQGSFSFLSVIKDIATGEILTYKISQKMNLNLVLSTIDNLVKYFKENNLDLKNILLHSDQGFQYTNPSYHYKLKELGIIQSMSRKGNSIDNAIIETFFGHMKDETEFRNINSFSELNRIIDNYMVYFNYYRPQWHKKKIEVYIFFARSEI